MEGSWEYSEKAIADTRQGVVFQFEGLGGEANNYSGPGEFS